MSDSGQGSTGLVRNPLTLIAVFAGVAEVAATVALPQLPESTQAVFVWFVMLFPSLLVVLFFIVLWNRHHVLYAPSDFKEDDSFVKILPASQKDLEVKKGQLSKDLSAELPNGGGAAASEDLASLEALASQPKRMPSEFAEVESRLVHNIGTTRGLEFFRDVKLGPGSNLVFDAVAQQNAGLVILEVEYSRFGNFKAQKLEALANRLVALSKLLAGQELAKSQFILALVTDGLDELRIARLRKQVEEKITELALPYSTTVENYKYSDVMGDTE